MIALVLALVSATINDVDLKEVERVFARNEEALARIRTVRATVEMKESQDGGTSWKPLEATEVVRDGRRELTRTTRSGAFYGGQWRESKNVSVNLYTPTEGRVLGGADPAHLPRGPLEGEDVDRITGAFTVLPANGPAGWSIPWKAQAMLMPDTASFRDVLNACSVHSLNKETDASGDSTWTIDLRPKASGGVVYYKFTFAPKHEYLATRQETSVAFPNEKPFVAVREVLDFWDFDPGLSLPKTIRTTSTRRPGSIYRVEMKDVQVNRPIDDREIALEFPEGAIVTDYRDKTYHLWGKDSPARTFASTDEFNSWNRLRKMKLHSSSTKRAQFPVLSLGIGLLASVGLVALIVYRRRISRAIA